GRLLARQFVEMWENLGRPAELMLVEAGAGVGRCAVHVLDFCEAQLPAFYDALRYVAVERSASRREQATIRSERHAATGRFAASSAAMCSPSITAILPPICSTITTCAGLFLLIKTIAPAKIFMLRPASRT